MSSESALPPPRFVPSPHECTECSLCSTGTECPSTSHPYNLDGETGLQCYMCSQCSHDTYEEPARRFQSSAKNPTWYVYLPIEQEKPGSEIMTCRIALAEVKNSKATFYEKEDQVPDGGIVLPVLLKKSVSPAIVVAVVVEMLKAKLRGLRRLYDMEQFLNSL